jgi:O-antigen/teichoic acid export membrane protein
MSNTRELQRQTIAQIAGRLVNLSLGLAAAAIMTRALGRAGFGNYTAVTAFLQFVALIAGFGLGMTMGRDVDRDGQDPGKFLGSAITFRLVTAGVLFALAPLVALALGYRAELVTGIALTGFGFWAASLSSALGGVFQAKLKSNALVLVDFVGRAVFLLGVAWAALTQQPYLTYLVMLVAANTTASVVALVVCYRLVPFTLSLNLRAAAELWHTTWPIALTTTLNVIYFKTDTVILSLLKPAEDVALYGAAYSILEVLIGVPAMLGGLVLPMLARAHARGDRDETSSLYRGTFDTLLALGLTVVTGAVFVGRDLMILIAGANFAAAGPVFGVLSLAVLCSFAGNAAGYALFAIDKQRKLIPVFSLGAVVGLTSYLVLIPRYSYWGAAWGTVIVELMVNVAMVVVLWRQGLRPSATRLPKILLSTLGLATGLALPLPLFARVALGAGLYLLCLWRLKLLPPRTQAALTM